jgi:hypothetical protein
MNHQKAPVQYWQVSFDMYNNYTEVHLVFSCVLGGTFFRIARYPTPH